MELRPTRPEAPNQAQSVAMQKDLTTNHTNYTKGIEQNYGREKSPFSDWMESLHLLPNLFLSCISWSGPL
jgi:hypothetical protein